MKTSIKLLSLLLSLLMCIACFAACNNAEEETTGTKDNQNQESNESNTASETETEKASGWEYTPDIEEKNYGAEFIMSIMGDSNKFEWYWAEESKGDAMSEALYARHDNVHKHIGVEVFGKIHTGNFSTYTEEYKTAIKNKDDSLQMMVTHVNIGLPGLITGNYLQDLSTVEQFNLDADYWDQSVMEEVSVSSKMHLGKNKFNILYTTVLAYNKTMMAQYEDDLGTTVYELVDNYKWTLDQMIALAKKVSIDTTSDGKTADDSYGIVGRQWEPFCGLAQASNIPLIEMNDKGEYVIAIYNDLNKEKSNTLVEKIKELTVSPNAWFWPIDGSVPTIELQSGRALIQFTTTNALPNLCNYEDLSFGVLPYPMFDETQKDVGYRHLQWGGFTVMPSYVADPAMVAETIELLAYYSYEVNNTLYEKLLGKQTADAPDDRRMLELVWDTICTDLGQTLNSEAGGILYFVPKLTAEGSTDNLASYVASLEKTANKTIQKFVKVVSKG